MSEADRQSRFDELLRRNQRRIVAIARTYTEPADTGDLVQEILMNLWRSIPQFREGSSIDTWVYRITLNVALNWKRTRQRQRRWLPREAVEPDQLGQPDGEWGREERILQDFLGSLGEVDRAILLLYLDNLDFSQMSEILGMSENAISVRLHRIRHRFMARYSSE